MPPLRRTALLPVLLFILLLLAGCSPRDAVSPTAFDQTLKDNPVVLVDFQADWCGPCKMMKPVVDELEKTYQGKVKVLRVNTDANPELSIRFHISGIPTFKVFKAGSETASIMGAVPRAQLETAIKNAL